MSESKQNRRYYLNDIPLNDAISKYNNALTNTNAGKLGKSELVRLEFAKDRITSEPIWAKISSPNYDAAAMDGVAVKSKSTFGASETSPIVLKLGTEAIWVDTGDPMPPDFDAVIMVEVIQEINCSLISIQSPAPPYQHVRPLGEDIAATEMILTENHKLRPVDIGACAAAGLTTLNVRVKPNIIVIPTGTELVEPGTSLEPGHIVEFNSLILTGLIDNWGGDASRLEAIPDDYNQLKHTILQAVDKFDVVVINAGSSAGSADFTAQIVEELGELIVHGVAVRPGHPVVLGTIRGKPVLGIPGYAVSAVLTCEIFLKPLMETMLGVKSPERISTKATITRKILSPIGEDETVRVRLGRVGTKMIATPVQRGAGVIMSLVQADGLCKIPRFSEGLNRGSEIEVELLRPLEDINNTIVVIGSHDLTIDLMANKLRRNNTGIGLSSSNVGSLGGLTALNNDEAHISGTHLLDEKTGEYNLPFIKRYIKNRSVIVMNLVHRTQGLMVPKGNPKSIKSLEDLTSSHVTFINRQRGSGTRILLDYKLKGLGITKDAIRGYTRECYTHLAVAAAVNGGRADVGLGIQSAAKAVGLDFVPLLSEQYDLVIPEFFYESQLLKPLLNLIRSKEFKKEIEALGGYTTSLTGKVISEFHGS